MKAPLRFLYGGRLRWFLEKPVHPNDLLATVYYALGIDPTMEIYNHLNQPRELVKGEPVHGLWSYRARPREPRRPVWPT